MIRPFSVFDKLNRIHFSDKQWYAQEAACPNLSSCQCPSCGAKGCLVPFAKYTRYLVEIQHEMPVTTEVSVKRLRCTSCRHTHAILPSCLVAYSSYSLRFILQVLRLYFLRLKTVEDICRASCISVSTLYKWKQLFFSQKALWLGILDDMCCKPAFFLEDLDGSILFTFLETYRTAFLERMPGRARELPFCMANGPGVIT